ncbi:MAG: DUF3899 domain-containing protein [Bacilli bacterium]|nr:DUF3899 domain-containing protein [Bacilli bacterium]
MENEKKKSNWKIYLITTLISLAVGAGIFCLYFFTNKRILLEACNGTAISGIVLICIAGLIFVAREGFFDFAAYGFKQFGTMLFAKDANKYNDYASYRQEKNVAREKRSKYYLFIALAGLLFVTAFIVLRIIYTQYMPIN